MTETTSSKPVLVVDDDLAIRETIAVMLEAEGYRVVVAAHGAEALVTMAHEQPAVILLDLNMPVMDGWELLRRLRASGVAIPVVFMTAGRAAHIEAERAGADGFLPKPFDIDLLYEVVARFAGGAR